jgi:SAM-dependent methyltransferase
VRPDDTALLDHYLARGGEAWNTSTDATWLEYTLRDWVEPLIPSHRPRVACNVGIGVGTWDDWLGNVLATGDQLLSLDRDPEICRLFALRQARERHALPARVVCGDVLDGVLPDRTFDLITVVGSTLDEIGVSRRRDAMDALVRALAPRGRLIVAELCDVVPGLARSSEVVVVSRRHARRGELALALVALERMQDVIDVA